MLVKQHIWKDEDYKKSILERDGNKCLNPLCRKTSANLCIHHIDYDKKIVLLVI